MLLVSNIRKTFPVLWRVREGICPKLIGQPLCGDCLYDYIIAENVMFTTKNSLASYISYYIAISLISDPSRIYFFPSYN